jgi:hypothetical protein
VALASLAAFLVVLALLASQLRAGTIHAAHRPVVILRRVYQTTVVETIRDGGSGTTVSQSASTSGSASIPAAPVTRSSG